MYPCGVGGGRAGRFNQKDEANTANFVFGLGKGDCFPLGSV